MDPKNLSLKDIAVILAPLVIFIVGLCLLASGHQLLALFLLVPVGMFFIYSFFKLPWQEIGRREYENEEKQKQYVLGRVWVYINRFLGYMSMLYLLIFLVFLVFKVYSYLTGIGG